MAQANGTRKAILAVIGGAAIAALGVAGSAASPEEVAAEPTGPLADEMAALLDEQPGGTQVSDNALVWDGGEVVVVLADPGEESAPAGLGDNVREDLVSDLGLAELADTEGVVLASPTTCPVGYYCFYEFAEFTGDRWAFTRVCSGSAGSRDFSNMTSSWVNRNSGLVIRAYDYNGGPLLWTMFNGYSDDYVGAAANDRMSYWRCL